MKNNLFKNISPKKEILKLLRKYPPYLNKINVYRELDLVYFSISKAANTSVKYCISKKLNLVSKSDDPQEVHHLNIKQKISTISIPKDISKYYKFSIVRNPFDRLVSCYKNKVEDTEKRQNDYDTYFYISPVPKLIYKGMSFDKFISRVCSIPNYFSEKHFSSQFEFLYKNNFCLVDYVGKFENLNEDFEPIRKKYNLEKLPHLNKTNNNDWKNYYNIKLAEMVYKKYRNDFETWYPDEYNNLIEYLNRKD